MKAGVLIVALAAAASLSGCATEAPDSQGIPPRAGGTAAPATAAPVNVAPFAKLPVGPVVRGEPVAPSMLTDLVVTLPRPAGWEPFDNGHLAPHAQLIAKDNSYPAALLMVYRLPADMDADAAIRQADVTGALPPGFTKLNESSADFNEFASAMIEGGFTGADGRRLHTYNRLVVPVTPANQRYLVQLTVTNLADQSLRQADDIAEVIGGFDVRVK